VGPFCYHLPGGSMIRLNYSMEVARDTLRRILDARKGGLNRETACRKDAASITFFKGKYYALRYNST
jgi:hypothetical protein